MPYANFSPHEVVSRGESIYQQQIRASVEQEHRGKHLVLDIQTGDYEIDEDDFQATKRLLAKRPNAVMYGVRIGHPAAYTLGAQLVAKDQ